MIGQFILCTYAIWLMYPSLIDNMSDVNKIIYYGSKPKDLNMVLIENVLGCISKETADNEKDKDMPEIRFVKLIDKYIMENRIKSRG
jgi:hypothetical protein